MNLCWWTPTIGDIFMVVVYSGRGIIMGALIGGTLGFRADWIFDTILLANIPFVASTIISVFLALWLGC